MNSSYNVDCFQFELKLFPVSLIIHKTLIMPIAYFPPPPQEYSGREDFEEGTGKTDSVRSPGAKWKVGEASVVE